VPGPLGTQRKRSHGKIWVVALLLALAVTAVVYALIDKQAYHETTILIMMVMGGLALWFAIAVLFYLSGAFSEISTEGAGWISGGEEAERRPVRKMERTKAEEQYPAIPVVINRDRRACTGDLILTSHRLYFICYKDESVAKAMGGKAVAQQFGILGALVLSLMTKKSGKRKEAEIEQARADSRRLPLEDRAVQHPLSLSLAASEVTRFSHSGLSGTRLEVGEKKYSFLEIDKGAFATIKDWCDQNGIETKGL
jgi:predicted outer membrane lipoprotein